LVHTVTADGRSISLLKVLMNNYCMYDCQYCVNRASNDPPRAVFTPQELADLTISFYERNYIEGLFLSSGVLKDPDYTMELMYSAVFILRNVYKFNGYVHVKTIPGASNEIVSKMGLIVDRLSVNIELPSEQSLKLLAPNKEKQAILKPMGHIHDSLRQNKYELAKYKHAPQFSPAGQATQMIIGATPDTDYQIMRLSEGLYKKYWLKRVYYTAYMPVGTNALLPKYERAPLMREHRLYQCDWMIRWYGYKVEELLSETNPHLDPYLDPKCNWAMKNLGIFPIEVNTAPLETLLRVPGIGPDGAKKIITARKLGSLTFEALKKMRIVLKRAVYFITCNGRTYENVDMAENNIYQNLISNKALALSKESDPFRQLTLFDMPAPAGFLA
jgi:putative DNA modification/repair radical SAM protein